MASHLLCLWWKGGRSWWPHSCPPPPPLSSCLALPGNYQCPGWDGPENDTLFKKSLEKAQQYRNTKYRKLKVQKLDGVGRIDKRPSTSVVLPIKRRRRRKYMWHMKGDKWYVTHDTWRVTCDWWWTLCKNVRSLALMVWDLWYSEDLEEKNDSITFPYLQGHFLFHF